jgi:hypothetical protein
MLKKRFCQVAVFLGSFLFVASTLYAQTLPPRISDEMFWNLITDLSERGGSFTSENFVSNERAYQHVLPDLKKRVAPGGVYLGVGPEQNFTYIAAVQPGIAFIVDIRRQNMIELLMYKALFELSANRTEFLSLLFSRRVSDSSIVGSNIENFLSSLNSAPADPALYASTLNAIRTNLTRTHAFKLSEADLQSLEHIFNEFYVDGLSINYSGKPASPPEYRLYPLYMELLLGTAPSGVSEHYLSTEDRFRIVKTMQKNNRIIPLVGDFAGSYALRELGDYLRDHNAPVTTFYMSNVEQYLLLEPTKWKVFYRNVASFPIDPNGVIIRSLIEKDTGALSNLPVVRPGYRMETMLFGLRDLASAFDNDRIQDYGDILRTANLSVPDVTSLKIEIADPRPNVGIVVWPNLEPPSKVTISVVPSSEVILKWPRMEQGDTTGFLISRRTAGEWSKLEHLSFPFACGSDPCSFRDSNVKAGSSYCYFIQAADDYTNLDPKTTFSEDFGEASITVCATIPAK